MAAVPDRNDGSNRLFLAMDLGGSKWVCAFTTSSLAKVRVTTVKARDLEELRRAVTAAKKGLGLAAEAPVMACYEAGREGFWLHRTLVAEGIESLVVDPAGILVDQRAKRRKTDRLDAEQLVRQLVGVHCGQMTLRQVVVPSVEVEDLRRTERERLRLRDERTALGNSVISQLLVHGISLGHKDVKELCKSPELVDELEGPIGKVPRHLGQSVRRALRRLVLVQEQLVELERDLDEAVADPETVVNQQVATLQQLKGVGPKSSRQMSLEAFSWRPFRNRKEVGSYLGAVNTPYASDGMQRDQGISKAGNARLRATMVELSWLWLRYQPESALSKWFQAKWGSGGKRHKRIGIVALARKLFIAFWRYATQGVVPAGAVLKKTPPGAGSGTVAVQ